MYGILRVLSRDATWALLILFVLASLQGMCHHEKKRAFWDNVDRQTVYFWTEHEFEDFMRPKICPKGDDGTDYCHGGYMGGGPPDEL